MNDYKRYILLENFKAKMEIENLSSKEYERYFCHHGCDVCDGGPNNVYPCEGYSLKHKEIFDGFYVCHECLCVEYNGINDGSGEVKT